MFKRLTSVLNGQQQPPLYEVQSINGMKVENRVIYYYIKWKGYSISDSTWEPINNLEQIVDMIQKYNEKVKTNIDKSQRKRIKKASNKQRKQFISDSKNGLKYNKSDSNSKNQILSQNENDKNQSNQKINNQIGGNNNKQQSPKQIERILNINNKFTLDVLYKSGQQGILTKQDCIQFYHKQYIEFLESRIIFQGQTDW